MESQGEEETDTFISNKDRDRDRNRSSRRSNLRSGTRNSRVNDNDRRRLGENSMLNSVSNLGGNAFKSLSRMAKSISKAAEKEREVLELSRSRISERNSNGRNQGSGSEEEEDHLGEEEADVENQDDSDKASTTNRSRSKLNDREKKKTDRKRFREQRRNVGKLDGKERALWEWANVEDLDEFLREVSLFRHFLTSFGFLPLRL